MSSITQLYASISDFLLFDTRDEKVCCKSKLAFESRRSAGVYKSMSIEDYTSLQEEIEQQQAIVDIQLSNVYIAAMQLKAEMDKLMTVRDSTERIDELTVRLYIDKLGEVSTLIDNTQVASV